MIINLTISILTQHLLSHPRFLYLYLILLLQPSILIKEEENKKMSVVLVQNVIGQVY